MTANYLFLGVFLFLVSFVNAQVCTGDFIFETQSDVDQFLIDNPTCTSIDGSVSVFPDLQQTTDFPTNLDALQNIQSISGDLIVEVHDGPFS